MKNAFLALLALAALPQLAQAKDVVIRTETESYSSPATVLLNLLQDDLAHKAIDACGGEAKVIGLSNINISVRESIPGEQKVASIVKKDFGLGLVLIYPAIKASAVANCRD